MSPLCCRLSVKRQGTRGRNTSEYHIHIRLRRLAWDTAWSDLVKVALYGDGPDVSEIGSTWLGDLGAMNALRLFDKADITMFGRSLAPVISRPWLEPGGTRCFASATPPC